MTKHRAGGVRFGVACGASTDGPPIRVFTRLDVRLLLEDLSTKLAAAERSARA